MAHIHPTAVVERGARVAPDAVVGPLCYVGPKATLGAGTRLVSHVSVLGRTTLGAGNTVWPQAVLGGEPQDLKFRGEDSELVIGDNNDIRELATLHLGTANGGNVTRIGSDNLLMVGCHVAHDCIIGNHVILANDVALAGHVRIEDHANLGGQVGAHHFVSFGQYCFVGGQSRVVHDVPPFMIVEGAPAVVRGVNLVGLERHRFPPATIERLKQAYRSLYRRGRSAAGDPDGASLADRLAALEAQFPDDDCVRLLVQFVRNTSIGLHGRFLETRRRDSRRGARHDAPRPAEA